MNNAPRPVDDFSEVIAPLLKQLAANPGRVHELPDDDDVRADVDVMYRFYDLQRIVRFYGQRHWEEETNLTPRSSATRDLENVAAHSFQVARCASLLAPHFSWLDTARSVELALVHDEPEVVTGDKDPVGEDGQGTSTHAFDGLRRREKELEERLAVSVLEEAMRPSLRAGYRALMEELLGEASQEARFVKAVDKLQALAFVRLVKQGRITPEHTAFTIRYARTGVSKFPYLQSHFNCVLIDLLNDVAASKAYALSDFCLATRNKLESASRK